MMKLLGFGKEKLPSVISDPFEKGKIISIRVSVRKSLFYPYNFNATGSVEFQNGNTKGEQDFSGETFDEVVLKIKAMLESL